MKIVSFGDSFIYGSELKDNTDGSRAWPGLVANQLGCEYQTLAKPGCGNERIAMQIMHYFSANTAKDTLAVINWTWTHRWDFHVTDGDGNQEWITLGESCVPEKLPYVIDRIQGHRLIYFYNDFANNSLLYNRFRTLQTVANVQQYLNNKGVVNIQTYTDTQMFDAEHPGLTPDYIKELQDISRPAMSTWNGLTFLEWCDKQNFYKTDWLHPLEEAHEAAANFWIGTYRQKLNAKD
jgi:hypothetical protein